MSSTHWDLKRQLFRRPGEAAHLSMLILGTIINVQRAKVTLPLGRRRGKARAAMKTAAQGIHQSSSSTDLTISPRHRTGSEIFDPP